MVSTSIYVNITGHVNDDDLYDTIESDDEMDRINRLRPVLEDLLYDMENEPSFTIKIIDE